MCMEYYWLPGPCLGLVVITDLSNSRAFFTSLIMIKIISYTGEVIN